MLVYMEESFIATCNYSSQKVTIFKHMILQVFLQCRLQHIPMSECINCPGNEKVRYKISPSWCGTRMNIVHGLWAYKSIQCQFEN